MAGELLDLISAKGQEMKTVPAPARINHAAALGVLQRPLCHLEESAASKKPSREEQLGNPQETQEKQGGDEGTGARTESAVKQLRTKGVLACGFVGLVLWRVLVIQVTGSKFPLLSPCLQR